MALPKVGARVKFRLYSGHDAEGIVRAIFNSSSGPKLRLEYGAGNYVATIKPEQIIDEEKPSPPEDVEL